MTSVVALAGAVVSSAALSNAQAPSTARVGVALPEGNTMTGLPAIAESLSSETLIGLNPDGRPTPRLAERWLVGADGRDVRFKLHSNLKLHDGTRADAATIAALVKSGLERPSLRLFHPRLADFFDVTPETESTLLLRSRSARILALEELADVALKTGSPDAGLGPFVVDDLTADAIELHGFRDYFRGPPGLERVQFRVYRSQRAAWTGMMRDETDGLYEVSRDTVEFLEKESGLRTHSFLRSYVSALVFNVARPVFRGTDVRRALVAAVNRTEIVTRAYRGRAERAEGPLAPSYWALAGRNTGRLHDARLAGSLLARYPLRSDGSQMPARVRFRCLVPRSETQPLERTALLLQKQLYAFGVDLQLEELSLRALQPRLASGDFDAVLMEFFGATPSWLSAFWHSPAPGAASILNNGYSAADKELDAMDAAPSEDGLRKALAAVYEKFAEDPPAVFIAWPEVTRAVSTRFDVPVEKGRDIMGSNLWLWRPAKSR